MGRRGYKRLRMALPVTISGIDTNGNPFKQTATAVEIGVRGLRLRDVYCLRKRGEPVQVQYKHRSAEYRVAWISEPEGLVGLEGLDDARFLFAEHLPDEVHASPNPAADKYELGTEVASDIHTPIAPIPMAKPDRREEERRQNERRRHQRYHCAGVVQIWESSSRVAVSRRMNEISRGGCYIEAMSPPPIGASIRLEVAVNGHIIPLQAVVRCSQQAYGMGLEFTNVPPAEVEKLDQVIAELSGAAPIQAPEPPPSRAPVRERVSGEKLAEAVVSWFGTHDNLSRTEFLEMIEQRQPTSH